MFRSRRAFGIEGAGNGLRTAAFLEDDNGRDLPEGEGISVWDSDVVSVVVNSTATRPRPHNDVVHWPWEEVAVPNLVVVLLTPRERPLGVHNDASSLLLSREGMARLRLADDAADEQSGGRSVQGGGRRG